MDKSEVEKAIEWFNYSEKDGWHYNEKGLALAAEVRRLRERIQENMEWAKKMRASYEDRESAMSAVVELAQRIPDRYDKTAIGIMMGPQFADALIRALSELNALTRLRSLDEKGESNG